MLINTILIQRTIRLPFPEQTHSRAAAWIPIDVSARIQAVDACRKLRTHLGRLVELRFGGEVHHQSSVLHPYPNLSCPGFKVESDLLGDLLAVFDGERTSTQISGACTKQFSERTS